METFPSSNLVVITARMGSERLPGKALVDICGVPNLVRIIRRFRKVEPKVCIAVATNKDAEDDAIAAVADEAGAEIVVRGERGEVLEQFAFAAENYRYALRATTDCPFVCWNLVGLAFSIVEFYGAEAARVWGMPDRAVPVYGAAEFPVSASGIEKLCNSGKSSASAREHVTSDIDEHREQYGVVYPVPPPAYEQTYYRPYRLELDTPEDLQLVRAVIESLGDEPPLHQVIRFLDCHPEISNLNRGISERTGPMSSYSFETRARWKLHQTLRSVEWLGDWSWINVPQLPAGVKPIYCRKGTCYIGWAGAESGVLHLPDGACISGGALLPCACGAGRIWHAK